MTCISLRRIWVLAGLTVLLRLFLLAPVGAIAAAPTISGVAPREVTATTATLEAMVDPHGKATKYRFEYGTQECSSSPCASSTELQVPATVNFKGSLNASSPKVTDVSVSAGGLAVGQTVQGTGIAAATTILAIAAGEITLSQPATTTIASAPLTATGPQPASTAIAGLDPGTTYHFRAFAKNNDAPAGVYSPESTFTTFSLPEAPDTSCPNQVYRSGPSAKLPDCRAYEQATPVGKSVDILGTSYSVEASLAGDAITFYTLSGGLAGAANANGEPVYLSRRSGGEWSTAGLLPPPSYGEGGRVLTWTPDLAYSFSWASSHGGNDSSLLSRRSSDGAIETIVPPGDASYTVVGASADGSKVFFESNASFAPGAVEGKTNFYLYERESSAISLAGALPDSACGSPPCGPKDGAFAGPYNWFSGINGSTLQTGAATAGYLVQDLHAISEDGERAYFTTAKSGQLYLREGLGTQSPETVQVSASTRSPADPAGTRPAALQAATPDGSKAFFTSSEMLTDNANTGPELEPATIQRSDLEGEGLEPSFVPAKALGVAIGGEHVYWVNPTDGTIGRAKLDAEEDVVPGSVEPDFVVPGETSFETHPLTEPEVLHSAPSTPRYVAVGPCADGGECVYWTNRGPMGGDIDRGSVKYPVEFPVSGAGTIGRAKLDGSGELVPSSVDPDFITGAGNPQGIAVNNTHIYWANDYASACVASLGGCVPGNNLRSIGRANLEGTEVNQELAHENGQEPAGVALDAGHLYWITNGEGHVSCLRQADLDGQNVSCLYLYNELEQFNGAAAGISVDGSHVYFAIPGNHLIGRAELNVEFNQGSVDKEFLPTQGAPFGIAVDPEHLFWSVNGEAPPNPGNDLYRYDAETDQLSDLTPDAQDQNGAEVQGVLGVSDDGSYVYFVANGDLDGSGQATPGDCAGSTPNRVRGTCNLYLSHGGQTTFVARLETDEGEFDTDTLNWLPSGAFGALVNSAGYKSSRVSADGQVLLFGSRLQQSSAYDNHGSIEYYRYDAASGEIACVTCVPSGIPASGLPSARPRLNFDDLVHLGPTGYPTYEAQPFLSRNLSADGGRVFFETPERLALADVNGVGSCPVEETKGAGPSCTDVYEWEAPGKGSCSEASAAFSPQDRGCLYLLSTGTSLYPSHLADVSASGDVAFIYSREQLVPADSDQLQDIYAATVDGGLASQHVVAPPGCEGEACRGAFTPAAPGAGAGSASFEGPADKPQTHRLDCGASAQLALQASRLAKRLARQARQTHGPAAQGLTHRAELAAKRARELSKKAKRCRRANRKRNAR